MTENARPLPATTAGPRAAALRRIVGDGLVWDNHLCMPLRPADPSFLPRLQDCARAGLDLVTLNVGYGTDGIERNVRMLSALRDWIAAHGEFCRVVGSPAEIAAAKRDGVLGVCFDIEGMTAVDDQPDLVRLYYDLGVRWMLVAYNNANAAGGGCLGDDDGLTPFGRRVIARMNEVGMVLCCTHTGYRTAREAIDCSSAPVIFSHSNPRALRDHPRNIPDELIRACAARGGVVGLNGIGIFLGENDASVEAFVRHVEHALDLVGDEHVGIGTDYAFDQQEVAALIAANPVAFPEALFPRDVGLRMMPPWQLPDVAEHLLRRGHSNTTIRRLMGDNLLRVAASVWK